MVKSLSKLLTNDRILTILTANQHMHYCILSNAVVLISQLCSLTVILAIIIGSLLRLNILGPKMAHYWTIMLIDSYFSNNNWVFTKAQYTWTKMAENVTDVTMTSGKITSLGKKISDFHEQLTVLCHTVNILLQVVI